jgi:hypothetical protein
VEAPSLSHGWFSSSSEVGRFDGSIVRQDLTNCLAVSDTPAQYSACPSACVLSSWRGTYRLKLVITITDCLHLFVLRVPVEGRITTKEEIGNNTNSPDIDRLSVSSFLEDLWLESQQSCLLESISSQPYIRESVFVSFALQGGNGRLTPQVVVRIENLSSSKTFDSS